MDRRELPAATAIADGPAAPADTAPTIASDATVHARAPSELAHARSEEPSVFPLYHAARWLGYGAESPPVVRITRGPFVQLVRRNDALVVWETDAPTATLLTYGEADHLTHTWEDREPKTRHVARLTGLRGSASYAFQAQTPGWASEPGRFTTEVGPHEPYRIAVFGDTRSGHDDHREIVKRLVERAPALAFHSGDMVADGEQSRQWDHFLSIERPLMLRAPLYPGMGNHEGDGAEFVRVFELPENSPVPERFYSVRWATSLFVVLDQFGASLDPGGLQYAWLEETLREAAADPSIHNRFVMLHHGPYDSGKHGSNLPAREALVPLFERYRVDIVFSGHDHDYERSSVGGVKYVVSGGAGAPGHAVRGDWWTEVAETVTHYCILDVHGARTEFKAWRLDGTQLDAFTLRGERAECATADDCGAPRKSASDAGVGPWACLHGSCIRCDTDAAL